MRRSPRLLLAAAAIAVPCVALAEGNLADRPQKLPDLALGLGDTGYGVSQKDFCAHDRQGLSPQDHVHRKKSRAPGRRLSSPTSFGFARSR